MLWQGSAASPSDPSPGGQDQQEDDVFSNSKLQYTLYEDWTICHKEQGRLSWEELATMPIFKGKRNGRCLQSRKSLIKRMGPKHREPEVAWTEEEDWKLCSMGDEGRSSYDIEKEFLSRNTQRCIERYFEMKARDAASTSRTSISRPARQAPALPPIRTLNTQDSTALPPIGTLNTQPSPACRFHLFTQHCTDYCRQLDASPSEPRDFYPRVDTARQQTPQPPHTSGPNIFSAFMSRGHMLEEPTPSWPFTGAAAPSHSTPTISMNNAASVGPQTARIQGSSYLIRPDLRPRASTSFGKSSSSEAVGNESTVYRFDPRHPRPSM